MQRFGIEIREASTMPSLYREVDCVLARNKVSDMHVGDDVKVQAVAHALQKMISSDRHFDIICVRNCAEITSVVIPKSRMDIYRSAHCMQYDQMTPQYRELLVAMILDDFRAVLNPVSTDICCH